MSDIKFFFHSRKHNIYYKNTIITKKTCVWSILKNIQIENTKLRYKNIQNVIRQHLKINIFIY